MPSVATESNMASRDCGMSAFDTTILLAGQREQPLLASILQNHNPLLTARFVLTLSDVRALEPELLRRARLVAFTTDVIVPPDILDHLGFGAYNFHPGPPHFSGWAPALFAVHHHATEFGVTAHMMAQRVDEGPIVGVELFRIPSDIDLHSLEELACVRLAHLFWRLAKLLATQIEPLPELPIRWSGKKNSRRSYAALCSVSPSSSKVELDEGGKPAS
jgi:methionyl-tRNA formyltransferase